MNSGEKDQTEKAINSSVVDHNDHAEDQIAPEQLVEHNPTEKMEIQRAADNGNLHQHQSTRCCDVNDNTADQLTIRYTSGPLESTIINARPFELTDSGAHVADTEPCCEGIRSCLEVLFCIKARGVARISEEGFP